MFDLKKVSLWLTAYGTQIALALFFIALGMSVCYCWITLAVWLTSQPSLELQSLGYLLGGVLVITALAAVYPRK